MSEPDHQVTALGSDKRDKPVRRTNQAKDHVIRGYMLYMLYMSNMYHMDNMYHTLQDYIVEGSPTSR